MESFVHFSEYIIATPTLFLQKRYNQQRHQRRFETQHDVASLSRKEPEEDVWKRQVILGFHLQKRSRYFFDLDVAFTVIANSSA